MESVLESYLNDFSELFGFSKEDESTRFEYFCNYISIPKIEETKESIENASVGKNGNPGIDGLAIIVNDHIVNTKEQVDYFLNALGRLEVEFYLIQAKTTSSFSMADITSYISCVRDFFNHKLQYKFNDETIRLHEIKEYIFSKSLKMIENPKLNIIYACTGQWFDDPNLNAAIDIQIGELKSSGYFKQVAFKPFDRDQLKTAYRELQNSISRSVDFEKHTILPKVNDVDEAFIGMLPASEFIKLICNDQDEMVRNIFYDNVRDFQGFNNVNLEIKSTIESAADIDKFSLLNNGVTIVAKSIKKTGTLFTINDYQIVNGCQTSHVIYYNRDHIKDSMYVPVKLIVTQNYELMSKIIRANNRQTIVSNEAFEVLAPFHKYLEEFYVSQCKKYNISVYYERRSNQYEADKLLRSNYITISNQIKSIVAMFMNEPHTAMQRYFGELIELYKSKIFIDSHLGYPYFVSGFCLNRLETLFNEKLLSSSYKRFKYHILLLVRIIGGLTDIPQFNSRAMEKECQKLIEILIDKDKTIDLVRKACAIIDSNLNPQDEWFRNAHTSISFLEKILPKYSDTKTIGTVCYYSSQRGFGYLNIDVSQDIFFHISDYHIFSSGEPSIGDRLKFDVVDSEKGLRAINIQCITKASC